MINLDIAIMPIIYWGRSGTVFFGSLLDNHPNILIAHELVIREFFMKPVWHQDNRHKTPQALIEEVLDALTVFPVYVNQTPKVEIFDLKALAPILQDLLVHFDVYDPKAFFIALHYAYALSKGQDASNKTHIVYHLHLLYEKSAQAFLEHFKITKCIGLCRHPAYAFASLCKIYNDDTSNLTRQEDYNYQNAWQFVTKGTYFRDYMNCIMGWRIENEKLKLDVLAIDLEHLHTDPTGVMGRCLAFMEVNFDEVVLESTIGGKPFWGDVTQKHLLNGFDPLQPYKNNWNLFLSAVDKKVIELIVGFGHTEFRHLFDKSHAPLLMDLIALPTKLEARAFDMATTPQEHEAVWQIQQARIKMCQQLLANYHYKNKAKNPQKDDK